MFTTSFFMRCHPSIPAFYEHNQLVCILPGVPLNKPSHGFRLLIRNVMHAVLDDLELDICPANGPPSFRRDDD
jgi:hypothetical protein